MSIDAAVITPLERVFSAVPGGSSPVIRALYGTALGGALVWTVRPAVMFTEEGALRPWAVTADASDKSATYFPWWMGIALPAIVMGILI
jgi:hypothetical protein